MGLKLLVLVLLLKIVAARIRLNVQIDENQEVNVSYKGSETHITTDDDIDSFKLGNGNLVTALEGTLGRRPDNAYVRSPTPWGDLYKSYNWEPMKRVLHIKSARVTNLVKNTVTVLTQDFKNPTSYSIKMNTDVSRVVENSLTTSWSNEDAIALSQDLKYEINVGIAKTGGRSVFSCTATVGVNKNISKTEIFGPSNVDLVLKLGEAVSAVLTAIAGYVDIEVVHEASLRGDVAVYYNQPHNGHHFHYAPIESVLALGSIKNKLTMTETIRINFFVAPKVSIYDKGLDY